MPTKSTPAKTRRSRARVSVQNASRALQVPAARLFRAWVNEAIASPIEVTVRLVGSAEGRRLNRAYRGRDYATNVLTFAYEPAVGDIVLCPAIVAREAREQGKSLAAHYAHLTIHAILHLRGYDHVRAADAARMERAEVRILRRLGLPNPYLI